MEDFNLSQSTDISDQLDSSAQPLSPQQESQQDNDFINDDQLGNESQGSNQAKKRSRNKNKRKIWSIDDSIKLLETRKDMEEAFRCVYHASEAWIKLVKKCGWSISWKAARDKFQNLKREGSKKKSTPTGISGSFIGNEKKVQLFELINYFLEKSHKYKPPKTIDSSEIDLSIPSSPNNENPDDIFSSELLNPTTTNASNTTDDINFTSLTEEDIYGDTTQNSSQDLLNNSSQETISPIDRSLIAVRKRVQKVTAKDIALRSAEAIHRISDNHEKLTQATMDYFEFVKEMKLETFKRSYGVEFNRKT